MVPRCRLACHVVLSQFSFGHFVIFVTVCIIFNATKAFIFYPICYTVFFSKRKCYRSITKLWYVHKTSGRYAIPCADVLQSTVTLCTWRYLIVISSLSRGNARLGPGFTDYLPYLTRDMILGFSVRPPVYQWFIFWFVHVALLSFPHKLIRFSYFLNIQLWVSKNDPLFLRVI